MSVKKDLSIKFAGIKCQNPYFLSSSPVGNNYDMISKCFEAGWGGVFYKTIDLWNENEISPIFGSYGNAGAPWTGFKNCEHASQNTLEENLEHMRRLKRDYPDHIIFASFMGQTEDDWKLLCSYAQQANVDGIEINLSCPHMGRENMGSDAGTNSKLVEAFTKAAVSGTKLPVIAKMTPNITNMIPSALAAMKGGAAGISAINTVKSVIDIDHDLFTTQPVVNGKSAISGFSGAAVKPIALRFLTEMGNCSELQGVPMSGVGGIYTWSDALDYLLVGARNVQVTTAVMEYGYRIVEDMISGMEHYMDEKGFDSLDQLVGKALPNIVSPSELTRTYRIRPDFDNDKCVGCGRCYVSCYDGGHQAIKWNQEKRRPELDEERCVGCHLCQRVCPVADCILPGELVWREDCEPQELVLKERFD